MALVNRWIDSGLDIKINGTRDDLFYPFGLSSRRRDKKLMIITDEVVSS